MKKLKAKKNFGGGGDAEDEDGKAAPGAKGNSKKK